MNRPGTEYKHSGKINFRNTIIAMILLLMLSALGGYVYAWAQVKFPYDPLNGILGLFFAFWQAAACILAVVTAQPRSRFFGIIFGFISSIFGLYYSWLFWVSRLHPSKGYYLNPAVLWEKIQETYDYGVSIYIWASRVLDTGWQKADETGAVLEAFAVTFICIFAGYSFVKDNYYCEKCQAWLDEDLKIDKLNNIADENLTNQALHQGSIAPLLALNFSEEQLDAAKPDKSSPFFSTKISLSSCPKCEESNLIKGEREKYYLTKKGNDQTDFSEIIPPTYLSRKHYDTLVAYFTHLKEDADPNKFEPEDA